MLIGPVVDLKHSWLGLCQNRSLLAADHCSGRCRCHHSTSSARRRARRKPLERSDPCSARRGRAPATASLCPKQQANEFCGCKWSAAYSSWLVRPILPPYRSYPVYAASLNRVQGDSTLTCSSQLSRLLLAEADRHVPVLLGAVHNEGIGVVGLEREARLLSLRHF